MSAFLLSRWACCIRRLASTGLTLGAAALLAACAATPAALNGSISEVQPDAGYRPALVQRAHGREGLAVSMSFSGGGTRAAALAYGVLEELARTRVAVPEGGSIRLLDVVDRISGVSGGSYPAAYYGLFGEQLFSSFEPQFLKRDVQGEIVSALLSPVSLWRMSSPYFGRSNIVAEYLDQHLFQGGTFGDMARAARDGSRPFITINASDMARTSRFEFTQDMFDVLCADLSAYPVARAVAASSAVPVLFSPITLVNRAGSCQRQIPAWVRQAAEPGKATSRRRFTVANDILSYTQPSRRYVHLLDGGLADNLGVRAMLDRIDLVTHENPELYDSPQANGLRRFVHILVNAQTRPEMPALDASPEVPTLSAVAFAVSNVTDRFSIETLEYLNFSMEQSTTLLRERLRQRGQPNPDDVQAWVIQVDFDAIEDEAERAHLQTLPTNFHLPAEDVDRLRAAGARLLRQSPGFQRLVQEVAQRGPQTRRPAPAGTP